MTTSALKRRSFLQGSLLAAAVIGSTPAVAAEAAKPKFDESFGAGSVLCHFKGLFIIAHVARDFIHIGGELLRRVFDAFSLLSGRTDTGKVQTADAGCTAEAAHLFNH